MASKLIIFEHRVMHSWFRLIFCGYLVTQVAGIMIKKICPSDESHKSCSFYDEYVCWVTEMRHERVMISPKRLAHCKSGCFCKKGYVRDYPGGGCIVAAGCRDRKIRDMLDKLPAHRLAMGHGSDW